MLRQKEEGPWDHGQSERQSCLLSTPTTADVGWDGLNRGVELPNGK